MSIKHLSNATFLCLVLLFSIAKGNVPQVELHQHKEPPIKVPALIDGTPFGINGNEIRKLIYIIREIEKMLHGIPDPKTKVRQGRYIFANEHHSVCSLVHVEHETTDAQTLKAIMPLLDTIIADLIKITQPFIDQARGVKQVTLQFMEEWGEKHHKKDSLLLSWGKEKEGKEFETFKSEVTTFAQFEDFCIDLISFLSDLIQSCPRGWQQFLELQKKQNK
jgi:hypothetical protein